MYARSSYWTITNWTRGEGNNCSYSSQNDGTMKKASVQAGRKQEKSMDKSGKCRKKEASSMVQVVICDPTSPVSILDKLGLKKSLVRRDKKAVIYTQQNLYMRHL